MIRLIKLSVLLLGMTVLGCGSSNYVPVSGVVTLDGKPLKGVNVFFQPIASQGTDAGGVGSTGMTDENGRFTLQASTATPTAGALVGKHTVRISTPPPKGADGGGMEDSDAASVADGKQAPKLWRDPLPERYNVKTELTFTVPPGGTDKANFDLTSK